MSELQFYLAYPKGATLSHLLSWSHVVELLKIDEPLERSFYEQQALREKWSVRELQRQKQTSLFLRLAAGKNKDAVLQLASQGQIIAQPGDIIRDPFVFEFLKIPEPHSISETGLETLLCDHLQPFLLLITKGGTLGRVALHDGQQACINQSVATVRVKPESILPRFIATCLLGGVYQERMIYDAGGTTIKHIYITRISKMPICYPSLLEQQAILAFLETEFAKLDTLTAEAQRGIALLEERRTALISAAVTGKIDVRGLAESEAA